MRYLINLAAAVACAFVAGVFLRDTNADFEFWLMLALAVVNTTFVALRLAARA